MSIITLQEAIRQKKTPIALGLMPELSKIPPKILKNFEEMFGPGAMANAEALRYHGTQMLDAVADKLPAVLLHAGSYLHLGMMGTDVLWNLISAAKSRGLYVILGVGTGEPAMWWGSGADALTVDPYLGSDVCSAPEGKAVFAQVRTGNPSGAEVQTLMAGDRPLYAALGEKMARSGAGLAIGTGYSLDIQEMRKRCEKAFLLLPGCDGANAAPAFDDYGHGAMVADFALQYGGDVDEAIRAMKEWVSVV